MCPHDKDQQINVVLGSNHSSLLQPYKTEIKHAV